VGVGVGVGVVVVGGVGGGGGNKTIWADHPCVRMLQQFDPLQVTLIGGVRGVRICVYVLGGGWRSRKAVSADHWCAQDAPGFPGHTSPGAA